MSKLRAAEEAGSSGGGEMMQPRRYAIKFNPPRFMLEYSDAGKTRIRSVRSQLATTFPSREKMHCVLKSWRGVRGVRGVRRRRSWGPRGPLNSPWSLLRGVPRVHRGVLGVGLELRSLRWTEFETFILKPNSTPTLPPPPPPVASPLPLAAGEPAVTQGAGCGGDGARDHQDISAVEPGRYC